MDIWNDELYILTKDDHKVIHTSLANLSSNKLKFTYHKGLKGFTIKKLAFGLSHILALTTDGVVLSMGNNEYGQLGIGGDN